MSITNLETITIEPKQKTNACVIWLHGLGADGYDFKPIVPQLKLPENLAIRFIFPHAPFQAVTLNQGMVMRSWYDIVSLETTAKQDAAGMQRSQKLLEQIIKTQIDSGIHANRIVLIGFSQGGAQALYTALRYPQALAGVAVLSGYLSVADVLEQEAHKANRKIPIMMQHGLYDESVKYTWGRISRDHLRTLDYNVEWCEYPVEHCVSERGTLQLGKWLKEILN